MYAKHPLCGIGTTLLKTCHLGIFKHISHQNAKKHGKHSIWENKTTLSKVTTKKNAIIFYFFINSVISGF